jgi:peptide/nickel transport system substrate-binding protein
MMSNDHTRRGFMLGSAAAGGAVLLDGLLSGCGRNGSSAADARHASGPPQRGGRLRLGIIDGNQAGNLDVHKPVGTGSTIRGFALYSKLWEWSDDMFPQLALAEFAEPNADASAWTIRLRKGLEFHNGKTITADDVIFSIRRITDPKLASPYGATVSMVDRDRVAKLDDRTVRIPFKNGIGFLALADTWVNFGGIVPPDYDPIHNPVGAGPFKVKDFRPGQRSLFTRFENYFRTGTPYPDELEIIDFKDQVSRYEALLSGQIDMANAVAPEQVPLFQGESRAWLLVSKTNWWRGFNLNTAKPPFNDPRVRQAFRLLADRQDLVQRVLYGHGRIANDLYAPHDPTFDHSIPQRPYDPDLARHLLREAGVDKLAVELVTDSVGSSSSLVFAEQARKLGIDITVKQVDAATYNGPLKNDWAMSSAGTLGHPYLAAAIGNDGPLSQNNRSNFHDPRFDELIYEALRQPDLKKRTPLAHEAQQIQYDHGGLLIWGFQDALDGISPKVGGIHAEHSHFPTWRFDRLWLNA